MRILDLKLKKKWYDMILSGEKVEEYRDIKPYWKKRLTWKGFHDFSAEELCMQFGFTPFRNDFDAIRFTNGYQKDSPSFLIEFKGIEIGKAKPEWSDNWEGDVFVIKLGNLIEKK